MRISLNSPVVSDAIEKPVAVVHHGSRGPQNCGVAHQAGRQHEVTTSTAADTNTSQTEGTPQQFLIRILSMCFSCYDYVKYMLEKIMEFGNWHSGSSHFKNSIDTHRHSFTGNTSMSKGDP